MTWLIKEDSNRYGIHRTLFQTLIVTLVWSFVVNAMCVWSPGFKCYSHILSC